MANPLVSASRGPDAIAPNVRGGRLRSWATRRAVDHLGPVIGGDVLRPPGPGDVAMFEVGEVSAPCEVTDEHGERQRLERGDHLLGVFGDCQVAGTLEARVAGLSDLSLLGREGLVGTVTQSAPLARPARPPTRLSFLGYGLDATGERLNLKALLFHPYRLRLPPGNVFLVVGASAGCGERTVLRHLCAGLRGTGLRVGVCRLTRPQPEDPPAVEGAVDLGDYGFVSSCGSSTGELRELFHTMLADLAQARPDVVLVALEGGILQQEVRRVLSDPKVTRHIRGAVLAAACATSALFALRWLGSRRHRVVAVSGVLSSAPLLVREFRELCERTRVPVGSADGVGRPLVHVLLKELRREPPGAGTGGWAAPASARSPASLWRRVGGGGGG